MKRIIFATLVMGLLAGLPIMGQTTPTASSTPEPKPKHATTSSSRSSAKWQPSGETAHSTSTTPGGTVSEKRPEGVERNANAYHPGSASWQGGEGNLRCMGMERRPCTESEVRDMAGRMAEKTPEHPVLANINTLSLASPEGAFKCDRNDGKPCTSEEIRALNEHVAEPMRLTVIYHDAHSNPSNSANKTTASGMEGTAR